MTKLAIFGDSFGDDFTLWPKYYKGVGPSWIDYLRDNSNYEITNFCVGASSFWYQYHRLEENHKDFDRILFLVTQPGRFHSFVKRDLEHWTNVDHVQRAINTEPNLSYKERQHLDALQQYFLFLQDHHRDDRVHFALLQNIRGYIRPDTKFISVFPESMLPDSKEHNLKFLAFLEPHWFRIDAFGSSSDYYDARKCHISEENHLILGKKILDYLDKDIPLDLNPDHFVHHPTKPLEHYFRPHFNKL